MQYSISNLNAFILLNSLGYSLYYFYNKNKRFVELSDKTNSPIQLINQIKGYFYLNPGLTLALSITLFSFIGVPPLIGFFAKQMILSSALENGFIFLTLIAILTSVISAVYYLGVIKQLFFDSPEYKISKDNIDNVMTGTIIYKTNIFKFITFKHNNVIISSYLTITISCLTLLISFFIFAPQELLSIANILALVLFNP
jgi:NADH-ubiquinone oxidoreductase chain 2